MQRPLSLLSATLSDAVSVLSQSSLKEAQAIEVICLDSGAHVPLKIIMMMMSRQSPGPWFSRWGQGIRITGEGFSAHTSLAGRAEWGRGSKAEEKSMSRSTAHLPLSSRRA